jgi:RNA polymerase sigma-70 factor (ECF subfamily)
MRPRSYVDTSVQAESNAAASAAEAALSFDDVYERYFSYVYRLVARLYGGSEIDDLVQDVFIVVHEKFGSFEGRASPTTWLFQIAYRVVGAQIRKERFRRQWLNLFGLEARTIFLPASAEAVGEARAVRLALERLSFKKRTVLVLFEVEGWSCAEIAERLNVPVDTVHTRLHHARRELARALSPKRDEVWR